MLPLASVATALPESLSLPPNVCAQGPLVVGHAGVVAPAALDKAELLFALSTDCTWYEYAVDAVRPLSTNARFVVKVNNEPLRKTL
jgi:hypothetical protein